MRDLAGSLDTNVLLRLLLKDQPEQHQAVLALLDNSSGSFEVADTAIIEVAFVLERNYGFTRTAIAEDIGSLTMLPKLSCNRALFELALPLFVAHPGLSFEDCCLSVYAELQAATPLWTFDKKLASQATGAKLVPTKQPQAESRKG
jgi:predicted nucleic-acid-binding protein